MKNLTLGFIPLSLMLAACSSSGGSTSGSTSAAPATATVSASAKAATTAAKTAEPEAKPVAMKEFDLSSADPKWKGWVAKGPEDAKVMADGVEGARIAANGPNILDQKKGGDLGFDVAFAWGKEDLKGLRANLEKGAEHPVGNVKVKVDFTKDEPDLLQWSTTVGDNTTYAFVMHMKVANTDVTCKNNYMIGAGNEAQLKRFMDACKTLEKKGK